MLRKNRLRAPHPPGILQRLVERLRGRDQLLVRGGEEVPLLLVSYPRGKFAIAHEVEIAYTHTLRSLSPATLDHYTGIFPNLPAIIVVILRPVNICGCLGHHHPPGTESRLTRRLGADLGKAVGEIDLAYDGIYRWQPQPLSTLAAAALGEKLQTLQFRVALLAVLLHELEHLASPEREEREIRAASNRFYSMAMEELVGQESGVSYGMIESSSRW
jgi:hypothetical protein